MIQTVSYWEDPSEFPYGPFVAVYHPAAVGFFRIEVKRADGKPGCYMAFPEQLPASFTYGWKSLDEITPIIEELNAPFLKFT